jgi:hypothetical protein
MTNHDFATISTEQLDDVTGGAGGGFLGNAWSWASRNLGGLLGGGGGINANAQIGNNQRSAQGNQGPVSLGDNSPININSAPQQ